MLAADAALRAKRMSESMAHTIYLKREDLCHTGAHKVNNTIGQILLAKRLGKKKIIAETGAGQHGVATATVCALMGMECIVYMGKIDMERQRPNVERMRILGTKVCTCIKRKHDVKRCDQRSDASLDQQSNRYSLYHWFCCGPTSVS